MAELFLGPFFCFSSFFGYFRRERAVSVNKIMIRKFKVHVGMPLVTRIWSPNWILHTSEY